MKNKKTILISLSMFIAIVFVLSLFGQQGKPFDEIWEKLNELEQRIITLEGSSGDGFPDYSEQIVGTWNGITYTAHESDPAEEIITEWEVSITFEDPDGDGIGTYRANPNNPFDPTLTEYYGPVTLEGDYQIKKDYLVIVIYLGDRFRRHAHRIEIRGNEMTWQTGKRHAEQAVGYFEKQ